MFNSTTSGGPLTMDRRWKTNIETAPNCPRCASTNTKFCYYNNYSLSQPRYFCKGCRRYWTKGGTLRNVPFGGGCRKHRRAKSTRSELASSMSSPDSDRVGSSYSSSSQPSSEGSLDDGKSGSDIDLAVVFSKFLNPESESGSGFILPEPSDPPILAGSSMPEQEYGGVFGPEFDRIAEFMDSGLEMGQLQPLLISDGVSQDMLWTEEEEAGLSSFPWEQEQVHGFDGVVDDHSMFHNNNNSSGSSIWNSFDIPNYGT